MSSKSSSILDRIEKVPYPEEANAFTEWVSKLCEGDHLMINGDRYEVLELTTEHGGYLSVTSPSLQQDECKPDSREVGTSVDGDILILVDHNYPINNTRIEISEIKQVEANDELYKEAKAR